MNRLWMILTLCMVACSRSAAPPPAPVTFTPRPIGQSFSPDEHPMIAHVDVADLDGDGLMDVVVCDVLHNQVTWMRQSPVGTFTESQLGEVIRAPAHAQPIDFDHDGDMDVLVASLGVMFPNNAHIGSILLLENDGAMRFATRVLVEKVERVADARAVDIDGDGDHDLAVAHFGYDDGATRWFENKGDLQFEPHTLQLLSGVINAIPADIDSDGDMDIVNLVSQEWEELYVFVNDGAGAFEPKLVWGSGNEDFGSSWISLDDLDDDGDIDIVYSNGDAFDYEPHIGRPWHGVQWLENRGELTFEMHRIIEFSGASGPITTDIDGDGDRDIIVVSAYNDWSDPAARSLILLENDGHMSFTRHDLAAAPTHLITVAAGDLRGDGTIQLVTGGMHVDGPYDHQSRVTLWEAKR